MGRQYDPGPAARWAQALAAWGARRSAGERDPLPPIPHAVVPTADEVIESSLRWGQLSTSSPSEQLEALARFIAGESHALEQFGGIAGYLSQQAYNSARTGPVADSAAARIRSGAIRHALLRAEGWRPPYCPRPAALRILEGNFYEIAITPDCRLAAGSEYEGAIWVWNLETGRLVSRLEQTGRAGSLSALAVSPDGSWAASGTRDGELRLWSIPDQRCALSVNGHQGAVTSIALAPDASWAITAGADSAVRFWDFRSQRLPVEIHSGSRIRCTAAACDATMVVLGCEDGTIRALSVPEGQERRTMLGHEGPVHCMAITPDGHRLLTGGGRDGQVRLWDLRAGTSLLVLDGQSPGEQAERHIGAVGITPDGRLGISGGEDTLVRVWDLEVGRCLKTFSSHTDTIISVGIAADGTRAVSSTACDDPTIRVWDLAGYEPPRSQSYQGNIWRVSLAADGRTAATVDRSVRLWDLVAGTVRPMAGIGANTGRAVALTPDGRFVAHADGNRVLVRECETGEVRLDLGGDHQAESLVFSPGGRRLASSGMQGGDLRIWDLEGNRCLVFPIPTSSDLFSSLMFSGDGQLLLTRSRGRSPCGWRSDTGDPVRVTDRVVARAFRSAPTLLPGGRFRLTIDDQVISLVDTEARKTVAAVDVLSTIFGNETEGTIVAAGDRFGSLHVFQVHDSDPGMPRVTAIHRYRLDLPGWEPEPLAVCPRCSLTFAPSGEILAVAREWSGTLNREEVPCLHLPDQTFEDGGLRANCPGCGAALQFEPFVVETSYA